MIQTILSNWNFIRLLRLIFGIATIVQAIMAKEVVFGIAGLLFTGMAIFNIGCCGLGGCNSPNISSKNSNTNTKDIAYEEVV